MPIHDWTRVDAGIFHAFHHDWITEIARALNRGLLPDDYYALPEQQAAGFGPDVLTLQGRHPGNGNGGAKTGAAGVLLAPTCLKPVAETDLSFYRRKQKHVAVRHVSGDEIVAIVELVSPGNKSGRHAMRSFVMQAAELIESRVNLLIVDLHPPGPRDPQGVHSLIWEEIADQEQPLPVDKALTVASYECALSVRAYVEHFATGDALRDMPLFLEAGLSVELPLEATYQAAFIDIPRRWRQVLEAA